MVGRFALLGTAFGDGSPHAGKGGVFQRISIAAGFGWLTALSLRAGPRLRASQGSAGWTRLPASSRRGNDRAPLPAFGSHRGSGQGMFGDVRVSIVCTRLVHVPCTLRV